MLAVTHEYLKCHSNYSGGYLVCITDSNTQVEHWNVFDLIHDIMHTSLLSAYSCLLNSTKFSFIINYLYVSIYTCSHQYLLQIIWFLQCLPLQKVQLHN